MRNNSTKFILVKSVLLLFVFSFLSNEAQIKIGKYNSVSPNIFHFTKLFVLNGVRSYSTGCSLTLHEDSSYQLITCGNLISGSWTVRKDSLLLLAKTNRWRNDSLHQYGYNGKQPVVCNTYAKYIIKKNSLSSIFSTTNKEKIIEILKYTEP